jgi:hypothetical protein
MPPKRERPSVDRALDFFVRMRGKAFCSTCAAVGIGRGVHGLYRVLIRLEAEPGFRRRYGQCMKCGGERLIAGFTED